MRIFGVIPFIKLQNDTTISSRIMANKTQNLYKNMKQTHGCKETRVSVWVIAKFVADYIAKTVTTQKSQQQQIWLASQLSNLGNPTTGQKFTLPNQNIWTTNKTRSKQIKGSEERYLLGQNTTCEFSG